MFGIFTSVEKRMRSNAENWLDLAEKIYHYRRDQWNETERAEFIKATESLRAQLRDKAEAQKLKLGIEALEPVLRRTGGRLYPHSGVREWVDFLVVGLIIILGLRAFFFQPFKIPTNSMWPSYNGMVPKVYQNTDDEPGSVSSAFRFLTLGASHYKLLAPESGRVSMPVGVDYSSGRVFVQPSQTNIASRTMLLFPSTESEYTLFVNRTPVTIRVPSDFDFTWVLRDTLGVTEEQLRKKVQITQGGQAWILFDKPAEQGKPILSFDILSGDSLFVDRMSYHFVRPKVGSGFVFRTDDIHSKYMVNRATGGPLQSYYIKRLVGAPGDELEIKPPMLYRNGAPITGAQAFEANNHQQGLYRGYVYVDGELLSKGEKYRVSSNGYIALGDNSNNSLDSRYWGEVPKKSVVGRPLWVFYPFNSHWGPAK